MQQGGGRGGGHQSQYGEMSGGPKTDAASSSLMVSEQSEQLEEASPISYRPPAMGNPDELMRFASGGGDEEGGGGGVGGGGGGAASRNRWPRQETLALLKIRSDMDSVFREATIKGPLSEDVSRKLAELGYKRSAKKCKEKFENVQKYYKRTKDGRSGRQDGKSYKFFSELEALRTTSATITPTAAVSSFSLDVAPISVGVPMPISSIRIPPRSTAATIPVSSAPAPPITSTVAPFGITFSSNSSYEVELRGEPSGMADTSRKRKRHSSSRDGGSNSGSIRKMEFFEGLMKHVMQKQEALQQTFLDAMEKREQDRMIREAAWKRQELARLAHEHELLAQERALASSRDAAIVSFLQNITGQTIQLPSAAPPPQTQPPAPAVPPLTPIPSPAAPQPQHHHQQQQQQSHLQHQRQQPQQSHLQHQQNQYEPQNTKVVKHQQHRIPSEVTMASQEQKVARQEIGGSERMEPASSRWPKAEVLALISIRSGLESSYQEAGPNGPLWEEISAGMSRMGYKRSVKRCKEKWENINKYFKKVKESNKQRPEDAKTCPYFHQLEALYRKKILGGGTSGGSCSFSDQNRLEGETSQPSDTPTIMPAPPLTQQPIHNQSENKTEVIVDALPNKENSTGSLLGKGNTGFAKKKIW
ncbi:trihelix transcription factor GTL1-like isoform X2 [Hibiscus syriacus]|uniref:trihelix transcription factor GTL1-like isoform X2 n=1 Tax=Hibiscus syriacus TaxID=106335 RepID=UPI0019246665|nr:trihelix transcription factor GTL1-like isoform X2 [Hibiscus syriacus]